jgi:hypothetical protein
MSYGVLQVVMHIFLHGSLAQKLNTHTITLFLQQERWSAGEFSMAGIDKKAVRIPNI